MRQKNFWKLLGLKRSGLEMMIQEGYRLLNLHYFFYSGRKRGESLDHSKGTNAQKAAGKIHSDIERGFIRAEVIKYDDLVRLGSEKAVKDAGLMKLVGRDYIVEDGDIITIRFNV